MHSKIKLTQQLILSCTISILICKPSFADLDELYHVSLGANLTNFNSTLSINSIESTANAEIDLEDDLGYDSHVNTSWISAWYRVGDLHRIKLTYTPIRRSSSLRNSNDIIIDNTIIKSGAAIESDSKADIIDFSYIYSVHKTPQLEMGLSAGIYWLLNDTIILAAGQIQAEGDDQPVYRSDYFTEESLMAPMPLVGFSANYEITSSWRTHASLRYLSVQVGDIDGSIFSAEIGTEYYFNNNWGIGASLTSFDLDVEAKNIITNTALSWDHNGLQIYAVFKY